MISELAKIKTTIINRILVLTAILLVFPLMLNLLGITETGWQNIYLYHILSYLTVLITALFRNRLGTTFKIVLLTTAFLLVTFVGLLFFSIGGGYFYAIMAVAILTLLVSRKITLWLMVGVMAVFSLFAYCFVTGILTPKVDLNLLSGMPLHWISLILSLLLLILIFIYGFGDIYIELLRSLNKKDSNEKKYRMIFDKANDAITLVKDGKLFDINQKACEMFQYDRGNFIGKSVEEISPEYQHDGQESAKKARHFEKLTLQGYPQRFEWQHKKANGELFDLSISLNKIELHNEVYVQGILRDITEKKKKDAELEMHRHHLEDMVKEKTKDLKAAIEEWKSTSEELAEKQKIIKQQNQELAATLQNLKEAQFQLLQTEKMASLGILTAGVAHEINNPLHYLSGAYYGLDTYFKKHGSSDETTTTLLSSIDTAINRISAIVKGLNQLSRDNSNFDEDCDIHSILDNCLAVLHSHVKHKAKVVKKYYDGTIHIKGNVGKLHQVFINIISNSVQAIETRGEISVATKIKEGNVQIEISDTGCGISKENLTKITDPFFTTKDPGKGPGLGLSITYSIIKGHKGQLNFESEINIGTTAIIILPLKNQ